MRPFLFFKNHANPFILDTSGDALKFFLKKNV